MTPESSSSLVDESCTSPSQVVCEGDEQRVECKTSSDSSNTKLSEQELTEEHLGIKRTERESLFSVLSDKLSLLYFNRYNNNEKVEKVRLSAELIE